MVACQCLVVLLGPQEIWVCRESDGSSHMELLSAACCGTADDSTATLPGEQARCEGGSCFDKPIDRTLAIRNARDVLAPCPEPGVAGSLPPVSQQGGVGRHRSEPDASARNTWREVPPTSPRSRFGLAWGAIAGSNGRVAHGPSCGTPRLRFARRHAPHTAPGKRASRNITDWTLRPGVSKSHPNPQHCPTVRCIRAKVELSNKVEGTPNKNPRQRGGRRLNASNCTRRRSSNAQERT